MLGQLFQSLGPSWRRLSRQQAHSEDQELPLSVTEDAHTRSLLFPDPNILNQPHSEAYPLQANTAESVTAACGAIYDNWNTEVGIDGLHDVRILVARDDFGSLPKAILFDSTSPKAARTDTSKDAPAGWFDQDRAKQSRQPDSPRRKSAAPNSTGIHVPGHASGRKGHVRGSSTSLSSLFTSSPELLASSLGRRSHARSSSFASIPENEVHRARRGIKETEDDMDSYLDCMFGNTAPSYRGPSMKVHVLPARKTFGGSARHGQASPIHPLRRSMSYSDPHEGYSSVVLVTRTFSLPVIETYTYENDGKTTHPTFGLENRYASGPRSPNPGATASSVRLKQSKVLFYAVGIAIRMPENSSSIPQSPHRGLRFESFKSSPSSYAESTLIASPLSSSFPQHWTAGESLGSTLSGDLANDFDTEIVVRHWDVISRTLINLQLDLQTRIIACPMDRLNEIMQGEEVASVVKKSIARVADAINTARVATGQGRWAIWRDEARWISHWAHSQQQDWFFLALITAWLANHREWLDLVSHSKLRRRNTQHPKMNRGNENTTLANRTVIVAADKMAARRLIFLLSAFLPTYRSFHPTWASTASMQGLSEGWPSGEPTVARHNRRASVSLEGLPAGENDATTPSGTEDWSQQESGDSKKTSGNGIKRLTNPQTASSLRKSELPVKYGSDRARRTSAVTVSSTGPSTTVPIAHIVPQGSRRSSQAGIDVHRDSNESLASANLLQNLHLSRSVSGAGENTRPQSSNRWHYGSPEDTLGRQNQYPDLNGSSHTAASAIEAGKLQKMVTEVAAKRKAGGAKTPQNQQTPPNHGGSSAPERSTYLQDGESPMSTGLPFKMSVSENDGVIDVDIPFSDFGSPTSSPSIGWPEAPSWDNKNFSPATSLLYNQLASEQPMRVAGWLRKFHQDWHLQAVKPYVELEQDIRDAMIGEQTPLTAIEPSAFDSTPAERWVDVCNTLVVDTDAFRIRRLRLRRLYRLAWPDDRQETQDQQAVRHSLPRPGQITPLPSQPIQEEIVEDSLTDADEIMAFAIEKMLSQSHPPSNAPSTRPSRANSLHGPREQAIESSHETKPELPRRDCERVILGALERIVKEASADLSRDGTASRQGHQTDEDTLPSLHEDVKQWLREIEGTA